MDPPLGLAKPSKCQLLRAWKGTGQTPAVQERSIWTMSLQYTPGNLYYFRGSVMPAYSRKLGLLSVCSPASSLLGSRPSTSLPQEGQSRVCEMHERQNVCWQLLTLWASNRSPLQTGQCSVLSLGPLEVPKPRGHVAAAAGVSSAAGLGLDAKGQREMLGVSFSAAAANGHPVPCMFLLLTVTVLLW